MGAGGSKYVNMLELLTKAQQHMVTTLSGMWPSVDQSLVAQSTILSCFSFPLQMIRTQKTALQGKVNASYGLEH